MEERPIPIQDLKLPPVILEVARSIEERIGRSISFRVVDRFAMPAEGQAEILNGIPIVRFTAAGRRPDNILHELLHLDCEIDGYPRSVTVSGTGKLSLDDVQDLGSNWTSFLEHRIIYGRMKDLGFDPYVDLDRKIEAAMKTLFDPVILMQRTTTAAYRRAMMTTIISRCLLENSPEMAKRVTSYAAAQGFGIEVEKAEAIVRWVRRTGTSPKELRMSLLGCLKRLGVPESATRFL
jgi:hypothetical protein